MGKFSDSETKSDGAVDAKESDNQHQYLVGLIHKLSSDLQSLTSQTRNMHDGIVNTLSQIHSRSSEIFGVVYKLQTDAAVLATQKAAEAAQRVASRAMGKGTMTVWLLVGFGIVGGVGWWLWSRRDKTGWGGRGRKMI